MAAVWLYRGGVLVMMWLRRGGVVVVPWLCCVVIMRMYGCIKWLTFVFLTSAMKCLRGEGRGGGGGWRRLQGGEG